MTAARGSYEFFLKMKKKPALQNILDKLETMSYQDIDQCGERHWIIGHLKRYRKELYGPTIEQAKAEAYASEMAGERILKDQKCRVLRYTGGSKFIGNIKAQTGDLFYMDTQLWIGTATVTPSVQETNYLEQNSEYIGDMTPEEYRIALAQALREKYQITDHEPTPGKITSADYTHTGDLYTGEILSSSGSMPITFKRH